MRRARRCETGSALVLLLGLSLIIVGFVAAFLSRGMRESRAGAGTRAEGRAHRAAEALLEMAEFQLRMGPTDPSGTNSLVEQILTTGPQRMLPSGSPAVNEISGGDYRLVLGNELGSAWVSRIDGDYLRLEAEASVGMETAYLSTTIRERLPVSVAQRMVSGYGLFPGTEALGGAEDPFGAGDVIVVFPPPTEITQAEAEAKLGDVPEVTPPGDGSATDYPAEYPFDVPMPDDSLFTRIFDASEGAYRFVGQDYMVHFIGDTVHVEGIGDPPVVADLPTPESGTIWVEGNVVSLKGQVNGRVTLGVTGTVHITGEIQYVDDDDDTAMLDGLNAGPDFDPNPDYDGNSVLGVVARGSIFYAPAMNPCTEIDAALFSQTGTIGVQMIWLHSTYGLNESGFGVPIYTWPYTVRGKPSLKELGSKACNGLPVTKVSGTDIGFGTIISRYDPQLIDCAPPEFPSIPIMGSTVHRKLGRIATSVTRVSSGVPPSVPDAAYIASVQAAVKDVSRSFGVTLGGP